MHHYHIFSSLLICLTIGITGCTSSRTQTHTTIRAVARVVSYNEDGMFYSPDQVCPSVSLKILTPTKYAGRVIVIGLLPVDPKAHPIYRQIASLVGKSMSLDLPEPLSTATYLIPPENLLIKEEPPQGTPGTVPSSSTEPEARRP